MPLPRVSRWGRIPARSRARSTSWATSRPQPEIPPRPAGVRLVAHVVARASRVRARDIPAPSCALDRGSRRHLARRFVGRLRSGQRAAVDGKPPPPQQAVSRRKNENGPGATGRSARCERCFGPATSSSASGDQEVTEREGARDRDQRTLAHIARTHVGQLADCWRSLACSPRPITPRGRASATLSIVLCTPMRRVRARRRLFGRAVDRLMRAIGHTRRRC